MARCREVYGIDTGLRVKCDPMVVVEIVASLHGRVMLVRDKCWKGGVQRDLGYEKAGVDGWMDGVASGKGVGGQVGEVDRATLRKGWGQALLCRCQWVDRRMEGQWERWGGEEGGL